MTQLQTLINSAALLCIATIIAATAASWEPVGPEDEHITAILPMPAGEDNYNILAGTDKGIWWYEFNQWGKIWDGPYVHGLTGTDISTVLVNAGNGSDSDGVYIGIILPTGGVSTEWAFKLGRKCPNPTALTFRSEEDSLEGSYWAHVYIGNERHVFTARYYYDSLAPLDTLPAPDNPFGTHCSALLVNPEDGLLYAGGNNPANIPGAGGIVAPTDTAYLLRGSDVLHILEPDNTSALAMTVYGDIPYLAVATLYSGIRFYRDGEAQWVTTVPATSEQLLSMIPFTTVETPDGNNHTILAVATSSDVYLQCPPQVNCVWDKTEDLPAMPTCLAQSDGKILWAGTVSGMYRREVSTIVDSAGYPAIQERRSDIAIHYTGSTFSITCALPRNVHLSIYDARGICVRRELTGTTGISVHSLSKGLYFYRLNSGKDLIGSGRFTHF